jgi:hypothetical protein
MTDTTAPWHADLSIDQQPPLRTAALRLADEFTGVYSTELMPHQASPCEPGAPA